MCRYIVWIVVGFQCKQYRTSARTMLLEFFAHVVYVSVILASVGAGYEMSPFEICSGALVDKGVGYNPFPHDCSKYLQCFRGENTLAGEVRSCSFGQFWDQSSVTCRRAEDVKCRTDMCKGMPDGKTFGMSEYVQGYWKCYSGKSLAQCCPYGTTYRPNVGCVPNPYSTTPCPPEQQGVKRCTRMPYERDVRYYLERIQNSGDVIKRRCAVGSGFNSHTCDCSFQVKDENNDYSKHTCKPILTLDFNGNNHDTSTFRGPVGEINIEFTSWGSAMFSGKSSFNLWRLANMDFRSQLFITLKFRPAGICRGLQALVANSNSKEEDTSIFIGYDCDYHNVIFQIKTYKMGYAGLKVPGTNAANEVTMIYDGESLTGIVNGQRKSVPAMGNIERRQSGLILGTAPGCSGFTGEMDDFAIYSCLPSRSGSYS